MQGKANKRRNKANSKTSINKNNKNKVIDNGYNPSDTVGYINGDPFICNLLKVVFLKNNSEKIEQTDTLLISYNSQNNEISEVSKGQLTIFLNKKTDIVKVKLIDCERKTNPTEYTRASYLQRAAKASNYLNENGLSKRKIELE
jgi:hypothetical protein